ncbi:ABC transporter permease [Mycolicibacterium chitae]|uniref:Binding-protein-dependent transport system inner membrane protein n=1 Tax=Mycolicibacterium chitae TaxID=1792 RepID=A0A3S4V794_MYCCI|nr:ABC transporter permease [Mycolicibacterium chitae]MCV7107106.1 ABC transporter permease [Mycolicibacterium chitae]BBZ02628.1 ABC transporter permease [Mycolicibacterium chitae]VEG45370.1 binding-protein-dependent transport system inner membrane protein [Mycolicibacterium chitae]
MSKTLEKPVDTVAQSKPAETTGISLKTRNTLYTWLLRYGAIALVLVLWELASGRLMESYLISSPGEVARAFVTGLTDGDLLHNTMVTLGEIAVGYPIGAIVGIATGFLLGSSPLLARAFQPIVTALFGIPIIALAPLIVVWLGIGYASKVGIVALLVFFLTFFNTYSGLKNMDRQFIDLARLMGADRRTVILKVVLPTVTPAIFAGLSIALPQSVIAATVGEFIAASEGLGYMIRRAAGVFDTPTLIVGALVLMLLVLAANSVLAVIERRVLVWRPQKEGN